MQHSSQARDTQPRSAVPGRHAASRGAIPWWVLVAGLTVLSVGTGGAAVSGLVLCAPGDPYRPLAREISLETGYGVVGRAEEALAGDPACLIWVVSPTQFSYGDLVAYAMRVRDRASAVSLGFITGRTLEQARTFWRRGSESKGTQFAIANGTDPHTGRFSNRLVRIAGEERTVEPLTRAGLVQALATADYMTFSGHGTPTRLRLDRQTDLGVEDVPALSGLVLTSGSCNSFCFWQEDSLVLALIERGAAAYAGFAFSPNAGYLLGAYDELPLRHTWPEFPIGHAVQALNHGCQQGFANFPFFLLAGDPRLGLRRDRPYEIVEDRTLAGSRVLRLRGAPPGVVPIRIPRAAGYRFVRVPGTAAAAADDWFYNARLQVADIAGDKYLLVLQPGGDLTVELHSKPPRWWFGAAWLAALDSTLIFAMRHSFDLFQSVLGGVTWLGIVWSLGRRPRPAAWRTPILLGLLVSAGHGLYMWLRLDHVVITSKPLDFSWLAVIGTFLTASGGAWLCYNGRRAVVRWLGLLLPGLLFLVAAVVLGAGMGVMGWLIASRIGAPTYNYHLAWPYVMTWLLLFPAWAVVVKVAQPRNPSP